jgi:hypothetical protein
VDNWGEVEVADEGACGEARPARRRGRLLVKGGWWSMIDDRWVLGRWNDGRSTGRIYVKGIDKEGYDVEVMMRYGPGRNSTSGGQCLWRLGRGGSDGGENDRRRPMQDR